METAQGSAGRVKLIGLGDPLRPDDAAGIEVARRVRAAAPADVDVDVLRGDPIALLDAWRDAQLAIVVDTVRTGTAPGTVYRLEVGKRLRLPDRRDRHNPHALSLGDLVELARALDRLPARLVIIGIEGDKPRTGNRLSAAVQAAVQSLASSLVEELAGRPAEPTNTTTAADRN
jgi:hydrogenase maturation protease